MFSSMVHLFTSYVTKIMLLLYGKNIKQTLKFYVFWRTLHHSVELKGREIYLNDPEDEFDTKIDDNTE